MIPAFIASQFKRPSGLLGIWSSNRMVKSNQRKYDRLIMDLDLQAQDKLLEIGYGPGIGISMIAESCSSCTVHGIDFSQLMYKRASKYNKRFIDAGQVSLQYGDFLQVPVTQDDYDKVFCLNVVYFWKELKGPFTKVFSSLKKGGSFHMFMADEKALIKMKTPDSIFNKYALEQVVEALKVVGFESVEHYEEGGHYIKAKK
jgi:cyclopropane fatty-acyl-phospholipid synthase-like methyltransferase